ncbi:hypothetical protein UlMin_045869, partial [Ulmus minor]
CKRMTERTSMIRGCAATSSPETETSLTTAATSNTDDLSLSLTGKSHATRSPETETLMSLTLITRKPLPEDSVSGKKSPGQTTLFVATLAGNLKIVKELVHEMEKQALIDEEYKYQPLFDAVLRDDWSSAQEFLSLNPEAVKSRHQTTGHTALVVATLAGNLRIVKQLAHKMLKQPLIDGEFMYQPLFDAVLRDDWSFAQWFLIQNPEAVNSRHPTTGQTALSVATLAGHLNIVKELVREMEKQALIAEEFEYQPLFDAVLRDDWSSAQEFLSQNPEAVKSRHPTTGQTALSVATLAGHLNIVKELVREMEKQALIDEEFEYQPLFDAILRDDWSSAQEFLSQNPEAVKSRHPTTGQTALSVATLAGNMKIVKELEVHKMEKQALIDGEFKYQPLFDAVLRDDWCFAHMFLSWNPEAIKSRHPITGQTALVVATLTGNLNIVQLLVHKMEEQALIDGEFMYQPLFDAVLRDDWSSAQQFLSQNPEAVKSRHPTTGQTALVVATLTGNLKIVQQLVHKMEKQALIDEMGKNNNTNKEFKYQSLFDAVRSNNWNSAQDFLSQNPEAVKSRHPTTGQTALYVATLAGNPEIVKKLVLKMEEQDLEIPDYDGDTALIGASLTGKKGLAECMVKKNPTLVSISRPKNKQIPVVVAASFGYVDMTKYLYSVTPKEDLEKDENGAKLLNYSIEAHDYDIVLDLLRNCPRLAITSLKTLAAQPGLFRSTCRLNCWQQWIYARIDIPEDLPPNEIRINVETQKESQTNRRKGVLKQLTSIARKLLGIEHIYELKLSHVRWRQVLQKTFEEIKYLKIKELEKSGFDIVLLEATMNGAVEIVKGLIEVNTELLWLRQEESGRTLFMIAVQYRQEKILSLMHGLATKQALLASVDKYDNTMLHMTGLLAPVYQLSKIAGPALQMQREMQWFKGVENAMPSTYKNSKNEEGKTARALFTETHKDLVIAGEKWMKETASSCTVVAALIITIMFAAAFTAPGGYNQNTGLPMFLNKKSFKVFIISDALSLFSSTTSALMFLGILTSRYAEDDFLKSLPRKLIIGLSTLFFSIAAMMVSFSAALLILLDGKSWILISAGFLSSLPVLLFVVMQFRLLFDVVKSTYGSNIVSKNI